MSTDHLTLPPGSVEWYTPPDIIEIARSIMGGIDCDPASCEEAQETVKAKVWYGIHNDGLIQTWRGRTWINPPYSRGQVVKFLDALEANMPTVTAWCMLVNSSTDTKWCQRLMGMASYSCLTDGRLAFVAPGGEKVKNNTMGQLFACGGELMDVEEHLGQLGTLYGKPLQAIVETTNQRELDL